MRIVAALLIVLFTITDLLTYCTFYNNYFVTYCTFYNNYNSSLILRSLFLIHKIFYNFLHLQKSSIYRAFAQIILLSQKFFLFFFKLCLELSFVRFNFDTEMIQKLSQILLAVLFENSYLTLWTTIIFWAYHGGCVSVTATDIIYIALIYSQFVRFKYKPLLITLLNTIKI